MIVLLHVSDIIPLGYHNSSRLVAYQCRVLRLGCDVSGLRGAMHLVKLGMADAACEELDEHLVGRRIG